MINVSKIIVISNIVVSAVVASVQYIFQRRFSSHRCQHKRQWGTGNSRSMEDEASDQNCDYRGRFGGRLNV
jgi:hypothetical protein